jgi:hypothetical protein
MQGGQEASVLRDMDALVDEYGQDAFDEAIGGRDVRERWVAKLRR